jgi:hypothetical protein
MPNTHTVYVLKILWNISIQTQLYLNSNLLIKITLKIGAVSRQIQTKYLHQTPRPPQQKYEIYSRISVDNTRHQDTIYSFWKLFQDISWQRQTPRHHLNSFWKLLEDVSCLTTTRQQDTIYRAWKLFQAISRQATDTKVPCTEFGNYSSML